MPRLFKRLFIPQTVLDSWNATDRIKLDGEDVILEPSGWRYQVVPAIHVESCVSGDDTHDLVGRVRLERELKESGGELYSGSLLMGEDAYEGVQGFLAQRMDVPEAVETAEPGAAPRARAPEATAKARSPGKAGGQPDAKEVEVLNQFLLEKL